MDIGGRPNSADLSTGLLRSHEARRPHDHPLRRIGSIFLLFADQLSQAEVADFGHTILWDRKAGNRKAESESGDQESGTGPILLTGKRDGSDIVKLGGPADVRAIFNPTGRGILISMT